MTAMRRPVICLVERRRRGALKELHLSLIKVTASINTMSKRAQILVTFSAHTEVFVGPDVFGLAQVFTSSHPLVWCKLE